MNSHFDIRKLLSAYSGDDLSARERTLVEEHLKECPACRSELADLQTTLQLVRTTPEVEPPPWMTARIMAHVREEKSDRRGWLKYIFFPLHIKIPMEIMAIMVVCVSGYYLSRTVETELKTPQVMQDIQISAPQVESPRQNEKKTKSAGSLPDSTTRQVPAPQLAPAAAQPATSPGYAPAPHAAAKREHVAPSAGALTEPLKPAPLEESYNPVPGAGQELKKKAAKGALRQELETMSSAPTGRAAADSAEKQMPQLSLRLTVPDGSTAAEAIRAAAIRSGGKIIEETGPAANRIRIRIPALRMAELYEQLGRIGRLADRPRPQSGAQELEVIVEW